MMSKVRATKSTCCVRRLDNGPVQVTIDPSAPLDNDVITQYRLQKAKAEILSVQQNAKANIDFITTEMQTLAEESESIKKAVKDLEILISSSKCKTLHPKKLSDLCKVKQSLAIDLSNILYLEKKLKQQLNEARTVYRNAKLDDQILNEDFQKFKSKPSNSSSDKAFVEKKMSGSKRLERELQCKKNAISAREQTISSVANSITSHVLQKLPGEHNQSYRQLRAAKRARKSVSEYITRSLLNERKNKAMAQTAQQIRQRRQVANLANLKREINEIKKTLAVKSHLRRLHDEEIAVEKEEVKGLLQAQGANPYLAEYLLAIEEKQREVQRKMLVDEQKRLLDMQREYSAIEQSKAKEEADRQKWDKIWSRRATEKMINERKSKLEMYFDLSGDEEDKEHLKMELHGIVTEQLNVKLSSTGNFGSVHFTDQEEDDDIEDDSFKLKISQASFATASETNLDETNVKPQKQPTDASVMKGKGKRSIIGSSESERSKLSKSKGRSRHSASFLDKDDFTPIEPSLRRAVHLEETQKESLLRMATTGENTTAILMDGKNVFDFGNVRVGDRKYMIVNVANIGVDPVKLKMSILNPYGPFTFVNSIKDIPQDSYYSFKFKFQPSKPHEESQETVKIEEVGKPDNFIIIKLRGQATDNEEMEGE